MRNRKWNVVLFAAVVMLALASDALAAEKVKLLLIGGREPQGRGFQIIMANILETTGDFQVTVSSQWPTENYVELMPERIKQYDVVLIYGSSGRFTDPAQEKALEEFVRDGGGLAGAHATDAFRNSDVYWQLLGGRFVEHGGGRYMVRIEDKTHPITAPMEDFEIDDETYRNKYYPGFQLHSLAHMDRGDEQQSMAWMHPYGKGRAFVTTLGDNKPAWENPHFQRLVLRGLYWVAGREPKDPPAGVQYRVTFSVPNVPSEPPAKDSRDTPPEPR